MAANGEGGDIGVEASSAYGALENVGMWRQIMAKMAAINIVAIGSSCQRKWRGVAASSMAKRRKHGVSGEGGGK